MMGVDTKNFGRKNELRLVVLREFFLARLCMLFFVGDKAALCSMQCNAMQTSVLETPLEFFPPGSTPFFFIRNVENIPLSKMKSVTEDQLRLTEE